MVALQPFDESYFATAPVRFERTWDVQQSAADLWNELVERPLHWCHGLKIRWTSPKPLGLGAKRHVGILGLIQADEHFFLWEEGRRHAFYFERSNLPVFKQFGEYYEVVPTGDHSCRFTWKLAYEPGPLSKAAPLVNPLFIKNLFRDTTRHFAR
jgi:hypothetical protein